MKQVRQYPGLVNIGSRRYDRVDHLCDVILTGMDLHSKVPLVASLGLVYVGVTGLVLVLGRTGRVDDGGFEDDSSVKEQAFQVQMPADDFKNPGTLIMPFEQVTEVEDGGRIGCLFAAQIDADEGAH